MITVTIEPHLASFRRRCRELLAAEVPPGEVVWAQSNSVQFGLFSSEQLPPSENAGITLRVPKAYLDLARLIAHHRDAARWHLLYSVLWRIVHGERGLLHVHIDDDVRRLNDMRQEIARDIHHMHAFVRFRRVERAGQEWFVAWYKPDNPVLRLAAPFFAERFASMRWSILTPDESVTWDGAQLRFSSGVERSAVPSADELENLWSTYYRTTFNPARMNLDLMRQEAPSRFWPNMPELQNLATIVAEAPERIERMRRQQAQSAKSVVPIGADLNILREAAGSCTACPLHCDATQTVFGEGNPNSAIVLVGEQPGDQEDRAGKPFVGPAGEVLDRAFHQAGIDRKQLYVTNAVKHFKFQREGKRRIHKTPRMSEIIACKPWLEAELAAINPRALVLLGASAAKSVLGASATVGAHAGKVVRSRYSEHTVVTVHPSFVLRSADPATSSAAFERLVTDLSLVRRFVEESTLPSAACPVEAN